MNPQQERARRRLVGLLWLYFSLLILEGPLRKWILPGLSDVLLIVRDPVAALAIYIAVRHGWMPNDRIVRALLVLTGLFAALGVLQFALGYTRSLPVLVFGLRTYFLHVPLVFIMGQVLDSRSLRRLVVATVVVSVPIALLMVRQFQSGPEDWVNLGVGEGGRQIASAMGKVRPAGPFSYVTGPVSYFSLSFACLLASHFGGARVPALVRWSGWAALLVAAAVSGSRALIVGLVPVAVATIAALVLRPRFIAGLVRMAVVLAAVGMIVWSFTVVQEGVDVLNARMDASGGTQELLQRSTSAYQFVTVAWTDAPLIGLGLGLGTNAGAALMGQSVFQLGENEWPRVILEAGPVVGLLYLLWRLWLAVRLVRLSARAAAVGSVLPLALAGACLMNVAMGQWGQPATQGFAVWVAGLCLASCGQSAEQVIRSRSAAGAPPSAALHRVHLNPATNWST